MSFLKDLKADWSQAVNELLPEDELLKGLTDDQKEEEIEEQEEELPEKTEAELSLEDEFFKALDHLDDTLPETLEELEAVDAAPTEEDAEEELANAIKALSLEEDGMEEPAPEEEIPAEPEETEDERELREIEEMIRLEEEEKMKKEAEKESEEEIEMAGNDEIYEDTNVEKDLLAELMEEEEKEAAVEEAVTEEAAPEKAEAPFTETEAPAPNTTIITKGTTINGSISSDGSLEVMGTITGDIECQGKLSIVGTVSGSSSASEIYVNTSRLEGNLNSRGSVKVGVGTIVVGDVSGTSAVIAGALKGEVDVNGPVIVDSTAIVKGNIKAKSVQINNGAVLDGYCSLAYSDVDLDDFFNGDK